MKAKLKPLDGKYYGTVIAITSESGESVDINLWSEHYDPSEREIKGNIGCSREEWLRNDKVHDGMGRSAAKTIHEFVFPHCENQQDFELAKIIAGQINTQ